MLSRLFRADLLLYFLNLRLCVGLIYKRIKSGLDFNWFDLLFRVGL